MSFWPFGQNINSPTNNINKILDEYFSVLHTIEQKQQELSSNNNNTNISTSFGSNSITISKTNSNSRTSLVIRDNENIDNNDDDIYDNTVYENSNNDNKNIISPLTNKFIDEILNESEVVNELNRKNSTLLDFMCFGYFFDSDSETGTKISNIEYLVNLLMHSCELINNHLMEEKLKNDINNESNENNDTDDNDIINDNDKINNNESISKANSRDSTTKILADDNDIIKADVRDENEITKSLALKPSNLMSPENSTHNLSAQSSYKSSEKNGCESIELCLKRCEIIAEIFSLNIWLITESLVKTSVFLAKLWSLLSLKCFNYENSPILSIFLKINTNLLINRQDQFLNFVRSFLSKPGSLNILKVEDMLFENDKNINIEEIQKLSMTNGLVDDMLHYIDSSLMNDFFLKIISTDKQDTPTGILELVYEQNLSSKLLDFFQNDLYESDLQTCSCDFFKAIIAISANAPIDDLTIGPNCLTRQLCTDSKILNKLIHIIVNEGGHALGNVVSLVIELIRKNNSDYDQVNLLQTSLKQNPPNSRDPIYLGYMVKKFTDNLHLIFGLLQTPYNDKPNDSTIYETDPSLEPRVRINAINEYFNPLGFEKFKIVELIAELLHCSNMGLVNSRRAELISRKRDSIRSNLPSILEEALEELRLSNSDREDLEQEENIKQSCASFSNHSRNNDNVSNDMIHSDPGSDNSSPVDDKSQLKNDIANKLPKSNPPSSTLNTGMSTSEFDVDKENDKIDSLEQKLFENTAKSQLDKRDIKDEENFDPNFYDLEEQEIFQIPETDEYFDIPYISLAQNLKIRENSTIGDYFKIRVFDLQILPYLVSMFLKYPWNNFWHNVIFDILQQIFNGRMDYAYNSFLVYALFNNKQIDQFWDMKDSLNYNSGNPIDFNLCRDLVINGYKLSNNYYFKNKFSLGYMGHLVLIAEEIVKFSKIYKVDLISPDIQIAIDDVRWIYYVEDILMDTRLMFSKILGGDIISTNGQEEEFLLKQQQEKRQKELMEMGLLDDLEQDELLLYSTQEELQKKLKTRLLDRTNEEVEEELTLLRINNEDNVEGSNMNNIEVLESAEI